MVRPSAFRNFGERVLFHPVEEELASSAEYRATKDDGRNLLVLADRLQALFSARAEDLGNACDLAAALEDRDEDRRLAAMTQALEPWLKGVLAIACPEVVARWVRDERRDNLFDALRELGLLTEAELKLDISKDDEIACRFRRLILYSKEIRNDKIHKAKGLHGSVRERFAKGVAATVLATLARHERVLRAATRTLVFPFGDDTEARQLCSAMAQEQEHHLSAFAGRSSWLTRLDEQLEAVDDSHHHVIVLHGPQGYGKSALVAGWTRKLADESPALVAEDNTGGRMEAPPWMPGVLLHLGKTSSDPRLIARSLLWQANALLLEPVDTPSAEGRARGAIVERAFRGLGANRSEGAVEPDDTGYDVDVTWAGDAAPVSIERLRNALSEALYRLVNERGPAMLVVDSVDEIRRFHPDALDVLPNTWPNGVGVVFTVRDGPDRMPVVERYPGCDQLTLDKLSVADVAAVLGAPVHEPHVSRLHRDASGWAPTVRELRREFKRGTPLDLLRAPVPEATLDAMAACWTGDLEPLLPLLALLEPCTGLGMEDFKRWWAHAHGRRLMAPALRRVLQPVQEHLTSVDGSEGQVRLVLSALGEHLRTRVFLPTDLREAFAEFVDWLAQELPQRDDLVIAPIAYWSRVWQLEGPPMRAVERLFERVYVRGVGEEETRLQGLRKALADEAPDIYWAGLRHSSEAGKTAAMAALGRRLFDGHGVPADEAEGLALLRKAATQGDLYAMVLLSRRLLTSGGPMGRFPRSHSRDGSPDEESRRQEALRWLRVAAEGGLPLAWQLLSTQLLRSADELERKQGEQWLRRAAEAGESQAMANLGNRLIDGRGVPSDVQDGRRWLEQGAAKGNASAMFALGNRLVEGHGLDVDVHEGLSWLRRAADSGDLHAMSHLARHLIDGRGGVEAIDDGLEIFRRLQRPESPKSPARRIVPQEAALRGAIMNLYRRGDFRRAATAFADDRDHLGSANSLLYMLRRGEVPSDHEARSVSCADLRDGVLSERPSVSAINVALAHVQGSFGAVDWTAAVQEASRLRDIPGALAWWGKLASDGDAEGDLVLAWLTALHGVADPEGMSIECRLERARTGGWAVPDAHLAGQAA